MSLLAPRSHLLNDLNVEAYRRSVTEGVERVAASLTGATSPFTGVTPAALAPVVDAVDLDRPLGDTTAALDELTDVYLRDAVYFHHPRYLAHLNCPVVIPAVLGEAVLSAVNSSLDTWDQSAGGTLIERRLIDWTTGRIGLGEGADGVFTSGGSQSNLQAMLLAREEAKAAHPTQLRVFTSDVSHFSVRKSATLLGLGPDAVVTIPTDRERRMRIEVLAAELRRCEAEGLVPMAVVGTARHHRLRLDRPAARDRRAVRAAQHVDARRRRLRLRPARLAHPARSAERHRARRLGHRRLPQVLLPAREFLRAAGPRRRHAAARHVPRGLPQPAPGRRGAHPQPGGQVAPDHPPVRRPETVDDAPGDGRRRHRPALRRGLRPRRRGLEAARRRPALRRGRGALALHPGLPLPARPAHRPGADRPRQPVRPQGPVRLR